MPPQQLNNYLAKIYEFIRYQQEMIFAMKMQIRSLEMALNTNQSFSELLKQTSQVAAQPEDVQSHHASIAALSLEIDRLRGNQMTIADA